MKQVKNKENTLERKLSQFKHNFRMRRKNLRKAAFTLIELIVVMAVIAILVLLAAPKFLGYTQKAEETKYVQTAKVIETALDAYLINGGEISEGFTVVDNVSLDKAASDKNLINKKGYMVSVDTNTYYELTYDFINTKLDVKLSASNSTPFIVEAYAAKSIKTPNAVYASSNGAVIIDKGQTLKGYIGTIIPGGDVETPIEETPVEETPIPKCVTDATLSEYFTFDGAGTITSYSALGPKDVVIPCEIDGVAVTTIGASSFMSKALTSVTIPSSVTTIGDRAFFMNQLTNVIISDKVTTIGYSVFAQNLLVDVTIPSSVKIIGKSAFMGNRLISITIPSSVTTITDGAFTNNNLTSVIIPESVTELGGSAFANNRLTSVTIPASVTVLEYGVFANNTLTSVAIPSSVMIIEENAFASNQLASVIIPDSVTTIERNAFLFNLLTSVTIPNSVIEILYGNPFTGNPNITYSVASDNPNYKTITENTLYTKDELTLVAGNSIGGYGYIQAGTEIIGTSAFESNSLNIITIPSSVTTIESYAFESNLLTSATIPSSVTSIGPSAFKDNQLDNLTIEDGTSYIESNAFEGNKLSMVVIPESVSYIGEDAFSRNGPYRNSGTFTEVGANKWVILDSSTDWTIE